MVSWGGTSWPVSRRNPSRMMSPRWTAMLNWYLLSNFSCFGLTSNVLMPTGNSKTPSTSGRLLLRRSRLTIVPTLPSISNWVSNNDYQKINKYSALRLSNLLQSFCLWIVVDEKMSNMKYWTLFVSKFKKEKFLISVLKTIINSSNLEAYKGLQIETDKMTRTILA